MSITRRNRTFHLRKRVPKRYAPIEPRADIWISLHTDSESVARQKAPAAWANMIEAWEAKLAGDTTDAEKRFEAARELAAVRGFRYLPVASVAKLPDEEFAARVRAIVKADGEPDKREAVAVLGTVKEPGITVERALELYWDLAKDRIAGKSEDQIRRWKNPRNKAVRNFVEVVGNKAMDEITADDMLDFRSWWMEKITADELTPNSANKDLIHFGDILKTVNRMKRLGLVLPLSDLSIKEGEKRSRPPFSDKWIKEKLLKVGALDGLNTDARCLMLGMINTGYRPSEGAGLLPEHIRLDGEIPYISIEPVGRQLKSQYAKRTIPLTGVSLDAFRECPKGFTRYQANSATLSVTIGKFLRENGLLETPEHSLYGLRHAFEDRMLAAGIDERIRRDLFGHSLDRERYGAGATLEHKRDLLAPIAIK